MADADVLKLYFKDIEKLPLLSHEEEIALAKRIKKGDSRARKKMVQSNLRLVINIAKKYRYTGVPMLDLIEEGNIGLMKAVKKYDHRKGYRFSTYAAWWIRQYIMRAIANQGKTIRIPVYMVETILRFKKASDELRIRLKRSPTTDEIAKKMKIPESRVQEIAEVASSQPTSLEAPIGEEDVGQFLELIEDGSAVSPDKDISDVLQHEHVKKLLGRLSPRDKKVLTMRFGIDTKSPLTLIDIAKHFKITKERVRQIEERAMKKLREMIVDEGIKEGIEQEQVI